MTSLTPGGRYVAADLHRAGGSAAVIKQLLPHLDAGAPTVDGRTLAEHAAGAAEPDGQVARRVGDAVQARRGAARPPREPRSRWGGRQARGSRAPGASGARSHLRLGGGLQVGDLRRAGAARRGGRRSQRGPCRRTRNAGDALDHLGDRRAGARRVGRPRHRRALQRRDARLDGRPRRARSGAWRPDRVGSGRRLDHGRCRRAHADPARRRRRSSQDAEASGRRRSRA